MDSQSIYKLNENLIIREIDKSLFSSLRMEIYNLNTTGFELIRLFKNKPLSYEEWQQKAADLEIAEQEDLPEFFENILKANIIHKL